MPALMAHSALGGHVPEPFGCGTAATSPPAHTPGAVVRRYRSVRTRPSGSRSASSPGSGTTTWPTAETTVAASTDVPSSSTTPVASTCETRRPQTTRTPALLAWSSA
ncbi:hypothetical protein QRT05_15450 [Cellulomonas sp. MW9]|uniref:Uncharacterized protein n=1 Tax=Cellulomonas edaphi TaxID=3053468 RepID=A0ABT7SCK3_9CELL|nr:hypothetical protein [Cellulomons edaphi]MDM7832732.1 hypothetical protein [Cellulomons edaphi]